MQCDLIINLKTVSQLIRFGQLNYLSTSLFVPDEIGRETVQPLYICNIFGKKTLHYFDQREPQELIHVYAKCGFVAKVIDAYWCPAGRKFSSSFEFRYFADGKLAKFEFRFDFRC